MDPPRERENYDLWLFAITIFLLVLGTVEVLAASYANALNSSATNHDAFFYFKKQAMWAVLALVVVVAAMRYPYWRLKRGWLLGLGAAILLLLLVLVPGIGVEVNGSRRWFAIGPIRFQPSEFAKLALVLFLARYSELWRGRITHLTRGFLPAAAVIYLVGGLIAKEDLGTAITALSTGLVMLAMMGARPRHLFGLVAVTAAAGVGLILIEDYRLDRITAWIDLTLHPLKPHSGDAYQPSQGLIALGSGGIWGRGLMQGVVKYRYLPAEHTDYIFATIGEETGLVGCLLLLLLFASLIVRGLTIAHRTRNWFGSLLASGLTSVIGIQAMLNIAVVSGLVPSTGVPLPFISYGGTSLVFTAMAVGIILNVSQYPAGDPLAKERPIRESRSDRWRHGRAHLSRT